ncbi:metallophosphoesterase [Pseudoalteromonas atlantica]|uniref:metallophosphoesterase n=1 Tax=Pseudoalteromonas atlantica TaxID=288 RepID=UPI0037356458
MSFFSNSKLLSVSILLMLVSGCGGDSSKKETNFEVGESNLIISVESGLSESFDNDLIELSAPANAVSSDTSFIFSKMDVDEANKTLNIVSPLYTFTPSDIVFTSPLTVTITVPDATEQQAYTLVQLVDESWQPLASTTTNLNQISAQISAFGTFAVQSRTLPQVAKTIGPQCVDNQSEQMLRFIHVADLHARFGFKEQYFSRIKGYYNAAIAEQPFTLFTNGGDDYEKGTVAEQTSMGQATVEAIKAMAFDVRVVGNHDYAWGPEQLLDYASDENAIVLASNTTYEGAPDTTFDAVDFSVVQVGCLKVGFFGMTSVPWNELDEPLETDPIPDFIANFKMNWLWQDVAQELVNKYRQDVDYMVMVSHLGEGSDVRVAQNVPGIDLVLGGHTHGGESYQQLDNGTIVIQPNFFAQGLTDLTLTFDAQAKTVKNIDYNTVATTSVSTIDTNTQREVDMIMGKYAPDAQTEIALSQNFPTVKELSQITGLATQHQFSNIDAVLFDPTQVQDRWTPGTLTQEDFHNVFQVERQPSNTSGFNAIYQVTVSGSDLKVMATAVPEWIYIAPESVSDTQLYTVALHKGPAFNGDLFFGNVTLNDPTLLAEAWAILDNYARFRTSQCLYIDVDEVLSACKVDDSITIWNFDNPETPLIADTGPAVLNYYDPESDNWGDEKTQFKTTTELNISDLKEGPSGVMAFARHSPTEGFTLTPNTPANGDFKEQNLISDYTLVMDVLWPEYSDKSWRSLLQTDLTNLTDAELYYNTSNGIGITTTDSGYFGELNSNEWNRIAFVFYAAPANGVLKIYINGKLVGIKDEGEIDARWAINQAALLFTENDYETEAGFLNAMLFAGRTMTDNEIASLGEATQSLSFTQSTRQLNEAVKRHYQSAPVIKPNLWLQQRSQFFNKNRASVNN